MMRNRNQLGIALFIAIATFSKLTDAQSVYSVASLKNLCESEDSALRFACESYVRGVVETWMLKDVVGVNPMRYKSNGRYPYCETITKVSGDEWSRIVRDNLDSMKPGFAAGAVMETIHKRLCK